MDSTFNEIVRNNKNVKNRNKDLSSIERYATKDKENSVSNKRSLKRKRHKIDEQANTLFQNDCSSEKTKKKHKQDEEHLIKTTKKKKKRLVDSNTVNSLGENISYNDDLNGSTV